MGRENEKEEAELRYISIILLLTFIIIWLAVITILCINIRKSEAFITDKNQKDINVVLKIATEEQKIEPSDDEIVISVGHGEDEREVER